MGLWAGIKYALNSTLGTSGFLPLDEQIASQKTLYASDNVYLTIEGSGGTVEDLGKDVTVDSSKKITMLQAGSLKIACSITNISSSRRAYFYIYKNGTLVQSVSTSESLDFVSDIIYVKRGDVLSFKFRAFNAGSGTNSTSRRFSDISILGTLVDNVVLIEEG